MDWTLKPKVVFHRDGTVSVAGRSVGEWRHPDPSGAPHARSPRWVFTAWHGRIEHERRRSDLDFHAEMAYRRLIREDADNKAWASLRYGDRDPAEAL